MAGRSARASGVVPPNQRMQLTPLRVERIGAILARNLGYNRITVYRAAQLMRSRWAGTSEPLD